MVVDCGIRLIVGHPEYGCSVNMTKSLANFEFSLNGQQVPRLQKSRFFPFCGNMIDTTTLDVVKDFTRMEGASISTLCWTDGRYYRYNNS
jgi:hypothetical protein